MVVSRAPLAEIEAFKKRMGWKFHWVSSNANDFNYDYHVSLVEEEAGQERSVLQLWNAEVSGRRTSRTSVFYKDASGNIFHTYSTYGRGLDICIGAYNWLDITPKGRDEEGLAHSMAWVRHHDKYGENYQVDAKAPYLPPAKTAGGCCENH